MPDLCANTRVSASFRFAHFFWLNVKIQASQARSKGIRVDNSWSTANASAFYRLLFTRKAF